MCSDNLLKQLTGTSDLSRAELLQALFHGIIPIQITSFIWLWNAWKIEMLYCRLYYLGFDTRHCCSNTSQTLTKVPLKTVVGAGKMEQIVNSESGLESRYLLTVHVIDVLNHDEIMQLQKRLQLLYLKMPSFGWKIPFEDLLFYVYRIRIIVVLQKIFLTNQALQQHWEPAWLI